MEKNTFEERAKARRQKISAKACSAQGKILLQKGCTDNKIPSTPHERGEAIKSLWELCLWLNPKFAEPMNKNIIVVIRADGKREEFN